MFGGSELHLQQTVHSQCSAVQSAVDLGFMQIAFIF
jgi:hypothetical protein